MYLSRIDLDPHASITVSDALRLSSGDAHQIVWSWLSNGADQKRDFLFRVDHQPSLRIWTLSAELPRPAGPWRAETKVFAPKLRAGDRMQFLLRANPTFRAANGEGKGKRHDVVMQAKRDDRAEGRVRPQSEIVSTACIEWLAARQERCGFLLERDASSAERYVVERIPRRKGSTASVATADLSGFVRVVDPARFVESLSQGIGSAKAFGCGLMLIRRA